MYKRHRYQINGSLIWLIDLVRLHRRTAFHDQLVILLDLDDRHQHHHIHIIWRG